MESQAANDLYGVTGMPSSPGLTCQKGFINDFDWALIPVFVQNSDDSKIVTQKISKIGVSTKIVINSKTKYPEAICRLVDYFFSAEGTLTGKYGFEGNSIVFKELPFADGAEIAVLNYDVENSKYKIKENFDSSLQ